MLSHPLRKPRRDWQGWRLEGLENIQGGQPGFQAWCRGVGGHQGRARRQLEVAMWVPWSGPEGRVWERSAWVLAALVEGELATGVLAGRGGARDGASTLVDRKSGEQGSWKPADSNNNPFRMCRKVAGVGGEGLWQPCGDGVMGSWPSWRWAGQGHCWRGGHRDSETRPSAVGRTRTNTWGACFLPR